ncbi:hypothetical protein GCM10025862_31930 [Arsenicicoccus piscis]|uniref:ADP/GDP-polyphosphate phosphotransferase n=1 Tax=Arsenicicoccus piscis TaxID=673954 RepID=A0ABQ6HSN0_9MICO|nr:hypothetical protein GCM10025862_31930 [Arsenicicoccus piscis]
MGQGDRQPRRGDLRGRDAAGKGSAIKRITQYLNPRLVRIAALPAPSDREKTQWYFQRYIAHLPAAGEIVIFDRSWYNRAGVERVMGFCSESDYERFLRQVPVFEQMLLDDGIMLRKYWFSVSDVEQEKRFRSRADDPMRRWKLSPMDVESITRWEDYSRAKDRMFAHTDLPSSPWFVVESEDKKRSRLNVIAHLLNSVPYMHIQPPAVEIPERPKALGYARPPRSSQRYVPDHAQSVVDGTAPAVVAANGAKGKKAKADKADKAAKGKKAKGAKGEAKKGEGKKGKPKKADAAQRQAVAPIVAAAADSVAELAVSQDGPESGLRRRTTPTKKAPAKKAPAKTAAGPTRSTTTRKATTRKAASGTSGTTGTTTARTATPRKTASRTTTPRTTAAPPTATDIPTTGTSATPVTESGSNPS